MFLCAAAAVMECKLLICITNGNRGWVTVHCRDYVLHCCYFITWVCPDDHKTAVLAQSWHEWPARDHTTTTGVSHHRSRSQSAALIQVCRGLSHHTAGSDTMQASTAPWSDEHVATQWWSWGDRETPNTRRIELYILSSVRVSPHAHTDCSPLSTGLPEPEPEVESPHQPLAQPWWEAGTGCHVMTQHSTQTRQLTNNDWSISIKMTFYLTLSRY